MAARFLPCAMRAKSRSAADSASASASETKTIWPRRSEVMSSSRDRPPMPTLAGQQPVGLFWAFAAGLVGGEIRCAGLAPGIDKGLHHAPARLDAVSTLEQGGIADHAVVDQRLVAGARRGLEIVLVVERHPDARNRDRGPGYLGIDLQIYAFARLDSEHQEIARQSIDRGIAEHCERCPLEIDGHLRQL